MLYYGRQDISDEDVAWVSEILHSDLITTGPLSRQFEEAFAVRASLKPLPNGTRAPAWQEFSAPRKTSKGGAAAGNVRLGSLANVFGHRKHALTSSDWGIARNSYYLFISAGKRINES